MTDWKDRHENGLYRSRTGVVAGVCRGLADRYGLRVGWLRFLVVLLMVFSGVWPVVILYAVAAMVLKPEPVRPIDTDDERDFYEDYVHSRHSAARRLKRRYDRLDRRLRRMEDTVTAREFDWDRRMGAS